MHGDRATEDRLGGHDLPAGVEPMSTASVRMPLPSLNASRAPISLLSRVLASSTAAGADCATMPARISATGATRYPSTSSLSAA